MLQTLARNRFAWLMLPLICLMATGCARYEYELVQPAQFACHIGAKPPQVVKVDPLEYRMESVDNRLVMLIYNPTGETIQLMGRASSVVDPAGESHPLLDRTIAPASFIKVILPPMPPEIQPTGPIIEYGFGAAIKPRSHFEYQSESKNDQPAYMDIYVVNNPYLWNWDGETDARLFLSYKRVSGDFRQEFTFHRKKM